MPCSDPANHDSANLAALNVAFGAWHVLAPWLLEGSGAATTTSDVFAGLALIALNLRRGPRSPEHHGNWDRFTA